MSSYRLLPPGSTAVVVTALLVLTAIGWVLTVRLYPSMSNMASGLGQVGHLMPDTMGVGRFAWMWVVMMVAMMAPTLIPVTLAQRDAARRRGEGAASAVAFVVGYFAVWWALGVVFVVPYLWYRQLPVDAGYSRWLPVLAGAVLAAAGAYQFTRRKNHCRGSCAAPEAFVAGHDHPGIAGAARAGAVNGFHCIGCCAGLMAVLLVVGLMNLAWMVALTLVFVVEKHLQGGRSFTRGIGIFLIALGLVVAVRPSVLPRISGTIERPSNTSG